MPIEKIIVLEDDLIVRRNLEQLLRQQRYDVAAAETIAGARELLARDTFDLIFLDVRLPDGEGTDLLRELQTHPAETARRHGHRLRLRRIRRGVHAQRRLRLHAQALFRRPVAGHPQERRRISTNCSRSTLISATPRRTKPAANCLGHSPAMENLRQLIRKVARTQATVLITGESGTGKELVARALYRQSPRANAPFIKVNCAAIPENLIESEFFGHEKGAFTGAVNKREGRFELAHSGTILLDEISEISPQLQAKLLRVLQERELERVGGNRTIKVDVRVIATTNRRLEESVERKEFRQDLFFRLNVVPIHVPPLREHKEDVAVSGPPIHAPFRPQARRARARPFRLMPGRSAGPSLARQRARTAKRHRARRHPVRRWRPAWNPNTSAFPPPPPPIPPLWLPMPQPLPLPLPAPWPPPSPSLKPEPHRWRSWKSATSFPLMEKTSNRTQAARLLGISIRTLRNKLRDYGVNSKDDDLVEEGAPAERNPPPLKQLGLI